MADAPDRPRDLPRAPPLERPLPRLSLLAWSSRSIVRDLYNAHRESWRTDFTNPSSPRDRVRMFIRAIECTRIVYRGKLGTEWAERR